MITRTITVRVDLGNITEEQSFHVAEVLMARYLKMTPLHRIFVGRNEAGGEIYAQLTEDGRVATVS